MNKWSESLQVGPISKAVVNAFPKRDFIVTTRASQPPCPGSLQNSSAYERNLTRCVLKISSVVVFRVGSLDQPIGIKPANLSLNVRRMHNKKEAQALTELLGKK